MNYRLFRHFVSCLAVVFCASFSSFGQSANRSFQLGDTEFLMREVSAEVAVYFSSMRLNRAANEWNVDVTVSNRTATPISAPLLLLIDSFTGTSGALHSDGTNGGKAFFEMTRAGALSALSTGGRTQMRTLSFGVQGTATPKITTRVYAPGSDLASFSLGFVRTLNELGQPLPGVTVENLGNGIVVTSDTVSGVATLAGGPGNRVWKFSRSGYVPVWRETLLEPNGVKLVPNPRLTRRGSAEIISPLNGGSFTNGTLVVRIAGGAVLANTELHLTQLNAQSLPALLPPGWSPLQAFWVEIANEPAQPPTVTMTPWGGFAPNETGFLARLNTNTLQWEATRLLTGSGLGPVTTTISESGAYALVLPDSGPFAPNTPVLGQPLPTGTLPSGGTITAGGTVTPPISAASNVPEEVTALAQVTFTNSTGNATSGTLFRAEVTETYALQNGTLRQPPGFEQFIVAYQRPGDGARETLQANFPIQPTLLFGPEDLNEALVRVDILPLGTFSGAVIGTAGGVIGTGQVRLLAGQGAVSVEQAVRFQELVATNFFEFDGPGRKVVAAFNLEMGTLADGRAFAVQASGLQTNASFVLARVVSGGGVSGLEPRERLRSDTTGALTSAEPSSGERLPGVNLSGQYLLVQIDPAQALVSGVARNAAGAPTAGLPVRIARQPWLTFSGPGGAYQLLAPAGDNTITVDDPSSGDTALQAVVVPGALTPVSAGVTLGQTGLRVVSVNPTNNATRVPRVTAITVQLNRPLNPATLLAGGIQLIGTNGQTVVASLNLNLANTTVTLLPATQLEANTEYRVVLAASLTDASGRSLEGAREFTFRTIPAATRDPAAQLIIYEPGATNVPSTVLQSIPAYEPGTNSTDIVVQGTPGAADPGVPVVLVNESTGETATILSKPDGSFASVISGTEADFVSATFVNLNGSRVYVPVSKQIFDNGFVGLYQQGGILEAQSDGGPVRVYVEPKAIPTKTKLRLKTLSVAQLARELGGTQPEAAKIMAGAITLEGEGPSLEGPVKVSFNVDLKAAGYPTNLDPRDAAVVLARVNDDQGVKAFEVLDQLKFTPADALQRQSTAKGALHALAGPDSEQLFYGAVESVIGLVPGAGAAQGVFKYIMVPLLVGGRPIVVKGRTLQSYEVTRLQNPFAIEDPLLSGFSYSMLGRAGTVIDTFNNAVNTANNLNEQLTDGLLAKPLAGAFVTLQNFQTPVTPGRLRPGMIYATSDREGRYLMVAPVTPILRLVPEDIYLLIATHPKFSDKESQGLFALTDIALAGVAFKDFVFRNPLPFTTAPQLNVAHAPAYPAPGEPVQLQINASQGFAGLPTVHAFVESVFPTNLPTTAVSLTAITNIQLAANRVRYQATVRASNAVRGVVLRISAISDSGVVHPALRYQISFNGVPPQPSGPIPPSDPADRVGPAVMATFPIERGYADESGQLRIVFSEPIAKSVEQNAGGIVLTGPSGSVAPAVTLSSDQTELVLHYGGLAPDAEYAVTLSGESIRDLNGNPLDQRPSTREADSFTMHFRTAPVTRINLPGVVNGRGSVINGTRLYVIDAAEQNLLRTFDISKPNDPTLLSSVRVVGMPRDLVVIPNYSFKTTLHGNVRTNDLVAVVGGDLNVIVDDLDSVIVPGQYIRIFDMADPGNPVELAAPVVTYRVGSALTKIQWHPPNLVYQEFAADLHQIGFVNLQELLIGFNATRVEIDAFPDNGKEGRDFNGDGDYVDGAIDANNDGDFNDPGDTKADTFPLPQRRPAEFFGKKSAHVIEGTTQKILDFSVSGGTVGVVLSRGVTLTPGGKPTQNAVPPQYRTITFNDYEVNPAAASVNFADGDYPTRVTIFDGLPILMTNGLRTPVVALVSISPDRLGRSSIEVIDISQPEDPHFINLIHLPDEVVNGQLLSIKQRPDGFLEAVTSTHIVVLDSVQFGQQNPPEGQAHPAIVGFTPQAGAMTKSVGSAPEGLRSVAEGARNYLIQTPPPMSFVFFPQNGSLVDPRQLPLGDAALERLMAKAAPASQLVPARFKPSTSQNSQILSGDPSVHYHVMVEAPGGSGQTIRLGLETLSAAGWPMPNKGAGFAPVRAVSSEALSALGIRLRPDCDPSIREVLAYRMSSDPNSPFFHQYLSRPIAVVYESMSIAEVDAQRLQGNREILWSGAGMRAFIDPSEIGNLPIGRFAARVDDARKLIYPIASVTVSTLDVSYIMGNNPPPAAGGATLPGTADSVMAHSGEIRTEAADMTLPSPRMPISIVRTIGGQDNYEGPFGMGWDFNYNQRITELQPQLFPEGLKMPLIERSTLEDSVVANSKDLLFMSGEGRIVHFRWIADSLPPEYAQDPLVRDLNYSELVRSYFLPEPGVFDLLVKFKDGKYERLTPEGQRFRYNALGKLEAIVDAFPKNRHELEYDRNGWLIRIDDRSVTSERYLEFGYYRRGNDPEFRADLDERTENSFIEGKICRLRDFAGGDILFFYNDEGLLIRREGLLVAGENGGFSGRAQTHYNYRECRLIGVLSGHEGNPILNLTTDSAQGGKPVAQSGTGATGPVGINVPLNNKAATLQDEVTSVTKADGSTVEQKFDKYGYPASTKVSGAGAPPAEMKQEANEHGQLKMVQYPEGRIERMTYDSSNPIFRSRANLLQRDVEPGSRGGPSYTETFNYDPRYNLQSGAQTDANGFVTTITLRSDGREVDSVRHGDAGTESRSFNDNGQVVATTDITGREVTYSYNSSTGYLDSSANGGNENRFAFGGDYASKMGRPASMQPPEGTPTVVKYDANLNAVEIARGDLKQLRAYDEQGRATYQRQEVGNGKAQVSRTTYNAIGFVTKSVTEGVEVEGAERAFEYIYTPDPVGRVQSVLHPGGITETFEYDNRGNRIKRTFGTYVEETSFDLNDNPTVIKEGGDIVATTTYDGHDRPVLVTKKTGNADEVETSTYYAGGELKSHRVSDAFGISYEQTIDEIDALGRPLKTTLNGQVISPAQVFTYSPLSLTVKGPRLTTLNTWNAAGYETGSSDPVRKVTVQPDANGRARRIDRQEDGATFSDIFTYDGLDNRTSISDLAGLRFAYAPRADGEFLAITNARGNVIQMEHSALGETLRERRGDGMEFRFKHDEERQPTYTGDPSAGFAMEYDNQFRLIRRTLRNGSEIRYADFDPRNMPRSITIPGGTIAVEYDLQTRPVHKTVSYQGTAYELRTDYDAMDRVRVERYRQGTGAENTATYEYDPSGVLLSERYQEDGADYRVRYEYNSDGTRKAVLYPSGIRVNEERDVSGRLTGLSDGNGNIIKANAWQGYFQPRDITLGGRVQVINQFDPRGRLASSRVSDGATGPVLAHMRYLFNGADEVEARQYVHRGGKADQFGFDQAERVVRAVIGGTPTNAVGISGGDYERSYNYSANGLDLLLTSPLIGAATNTPAFASSWSSHDAFLVPGLVDGTTRSSDPMGNVATGRLFAREFNSAEPVPVPATFLHNGLGNLIRIERADGVTIENQFQPSGLRFSRRVFRDGSLVQHRHFVYDSDARLIEEYERAEPGTGLIARYYYASSDSPVAADLRDSVSSSFTRYYFARDVSQSIVAVFDKDGRPVERVWYDTFGQPVIEQADTAPPRIHRVIGGANGTLLVELTEPVLPAFDDPGVGTGLVPLTGQLTNLVSGLGGRQELLTNLAGFRPSTVIQITPTNPATGQLTLSLVATSIADEWGNKASAQPVTLNATGNAGSVYFTATGPASTAPTRSARSTVGLPFLFHGQYLDYDSGLIYLRARFYDPASAMFFEPDPLGYEDSVNLYAGFGNDPVSMRDPTGLRRQTAAGAVKQQRTARKSAGREAHEFLSESGLTDLEIEAISSVLSSRNQNITLSIRRFQKYDAQGRMIPANTAGFRRANASRGVLLKGAGFKSKNNNFAQGKFRTKRKKGARKDSEGHITSYRHDGSEQMQITSDLDALHVMIDGQFATVKEIRGLFREINQKFRELHNARYAHLGNKAPRANAPFQHEAHAHLLHQLGQSVGKKVGKKGYVSYEDLKAIGHPGDAFQLSFTKGGTGLAARNLDRSEVGQILSDARDDFNFRKENDLELMEQLDRVGLLGVDDWPDTYKTFKDGSSPTPGM